MGTPIDCPTPLWVPGSDCTTCTPALWISGQTPKYVYAVFTGMTKCTGAPADPPNDHVFTLEQRAASPCDWDIINDTTWEGSWDLLSDRSYLKLFHIASSLTYFSGTIMSTCQHTFPSNDSSCPADAAEGGNAHVWYEPDDIPRLLCCSYHFHPIPNNLFDRIESDPGFQCIKIANRSDKTNLLFLIDNSYFPPYT